MKGFITFYINIIPELNQNQDAILQFVRDSNKDLLKMLKEQGYEAMFVPTFREASRVEKVDLDKPHPRTIGIRRREERND